MLILKEKGPTDMFKMNISTNLTRGIKETGQFQDGIRILRL